MLHIVYFLLTSIAYKWLFCSPLVGLIVLIGAPIFVCLQKHLVCCLLVIDWSLHCQRSFRHICFSRPFWCIIVLDVPIFVVDLIDCMNHPFLQTVASSIVGLWRRLSYNADDDDDGEDEDEDNGDHSGSNEGFLKSFFDCCCRVVHRASTEFSWSAVDKKYCCWQELPKAFWNTILSHLSLFHVNKNNWKLSLPSWPRVDPPLLILLLPPLSASFLTSFFASLHFQFWSRIPLGSFLFETSEYIKL